MLAPDRSSEGKCFRQYCRVQGDLVVQRTQHLGDGTLLHSRRTDDGVEELGSTYLWADGLAVTVSEPSDYQPGQYAAGTDEFSKFVVFDVTIVNNTGAVWDPVLFRASVQSASQEASKVYDSENLPDTPSTKLLDGREATFKMASVSPIQQTSSLR